MPGVQIKGVGIQMQVPRPHCWVWQVATRPSHPRAKGTRSFHCFTRTQEVQVAHPLLLSIGDK